MTEDFLRHAMTECNHESLVASVLLARQACLEGQHLFKSYEDWFQVIVLVHNIVMDHISSASTLTTMTKVYFLLRPTYH